PSGDLEPAREVVASLQAWRHTSEQTSTHNKHRPIVSDSVELPASPLELRRLADEFQAPMPAIDETLRQKIQRKRHSHGALLPASSALASGPPGREPRHRSFGPVLLIGTGLAVAGILLAILGQPVFGVSLIVAGLGAATVALTLR